MFKRIPKMPVPYSHVLIVHAASPPQRGTLITSVSMCNLQVLTTDCFSSIDLPLRSLKTWSVQVTEALVFLAACVEHAYIHPYIHDIQIRPNTIPHTFFLVLFCLASIYSSIPGKPWFQDANTRTHLFYPETKRKQLQNHGTGNTPQKKKKLPKMLNSHSLDSLKSGWEWIVDFVFPFLKLFSTSLSNLLERQSKLTYSPLSKPKLQYLRHTGDRNVL